MKLVTPLVLAVFARCPASVLATSLLQVVKEVIPMRPRTMPDLWINVDQADQASSGPPQNMADFYRGANSYAAGMVKYPQDERTMGDFYHDSFEAERYPGIVVVTAPPTMLRVSRWISGLFLGCVLALTTFTLASGWKPRVDQDKTDASDLLERCIDVGSLPSGTVCAVCLEDSAADHKCPDGDSSDHKWCQTPCGHSFHRTCLDRWISTAVPGRKRCPLCNWA